MSIPRLESRVYADVNVTRPSEYTDFESMDIPWGSEENYNIGRKLTRRKNYKLYEGVRLSDNVRVLIKIHDADVDDTQIKKEIKILQNLYGGPNIAKLLDVVRDEFSMTPKLIFEHVNNTRLRTLVPAMSVDAIRGYTFQLLKALDYSHSHGIMNRDVNPDTVFIDGATGKVCLMDWGQADFYYPARKYNTEIGSQFYKGPELLVNIECYDYSVDLWSVGCLLADMVSGVVPFFDSGKKDSKELKKIATVLGRYTLDRYLNKYRKTASFGRVRVGPENWSEALFKHHNRQHLAVDGTYDLLTGLLQYDHERRLTAEEALAHEYFLPLKN